MIPYAKFAAAAIATALLAALWWGVRMSGYKAAQRDAKYEIAKMQIAHQKELQAIKDDHQAQRDKQEAEHGFALEQAEKSTRKAQNEHQRLKQELANRTAKARSDIAAINLRGVLNDASERECAEGMRTGKPATASDGGVPAGSLD
jgi:hypothetical protein